MKSKSVLAFAVSFVVAAAVFAQQAAGSTPIFKPAADQKWMDLDPTGAPGIKIADVWGDHAKTKFGAFIKFPAGFLSPLHTHTYPINIVVVSGSYTQAPEGKATARLGPGSYAYQPGGSYKHVTGCDKASECVIYIDSTGPFDLLPVAAPAAVK